MEQLKNISETNNHCAYSSMEQRPSSHTTMTFELMYSAISNNGAFMGEGTAVDISKGSLTIHGNHPVKVGTELSMLLYLPDGNDPLFILEAVVTWASGSHFGTEFTKVNLREANRLRSFLHARSTLAILPIDQ